MGYAPAFKDQSEYSPLDLIGGDFPLKSESITLEAGQVLQRGAVLGRKTANGKFVLSAKVAGNNDPVTDGSEQPLRILAEDMDTTGEDKPTIAYRTGSFRAAGLKIGKGHSLVSMKSELETRSIFIEG
ncbi:MAG TPA: head decoration protein [Oligoflexus sp.]|uniref:head decoration protein n=1 Tax=Oligoflexus sp. TaxID=1971216 RepID=UPI002D601E7B|nr:head decoration protein [Oligoflexus sp.]HYX35311.1 head decoration protein [Oligoflexus sp.]